MLFGLRWRVYAHGFDEVIRVQRTTDEDTGDSGVIVVKGNKISNKYVAEWILGDWAGDRGRYRGPICRPDLAILKSMGPALDSPDSTFCLIQSF